MSKPRTTFLDLVKVCDDFPYETEYCESFYQLFLPNDNRPHGYMLPSVVQKMPWTPEFDISHDYPRSVRLRDTSKGKDVSAASNASFAKVVNEAIDRNVFSTIHGQHSEPFSIPGANQPVNIERFATPLFGTTGRGAHATMYTRTPSGLKIWVPRRSHLVYTFPGMLDTTVAGGVKATETPFETVVHESDEEAALDEALVRRDLCAVGALTYMTETKKPPGEGQETSLVRADIIYVFDLELPADVVPKPRDQEVKEFYLWSVEEITRALLNSEFKPNSAVVMIDFFIRHGIITAENEKDYVEIITRMHRRLPFPLAPETV